MVIATEIGTEDTAAVVGTMIMGAGNGIMMATGTTTHANNEGTSVRDSCPGSWWVSRHCSISYSRSSGVSHDFLRVKTYRTISRTRVRLCNQHV